MTTIGKLLPRLGGLALAASAAVALRRRMQMGEGYHVTLQPFAERNDALASLLTTMPDKIDFISNSQYTFTFADGKDVNALPIGSEYMMVYSNDGSRHPWNAIRFRVVPNPTGMSTSLQVVDERSLEPHEIAHFEYLIAQHQGQLLRENG